MQWLYDEDSQRNSVQWLCDEDSDEFSAVAM